jgi:uncharacterized delta-60 repeat protein
MKNLSNHLCNAMPLQNGRQLNKTVLSTHKLFDSFAQYSRVISAIAVLSFLNLCFAAPSTLDDTFSSDGKRIIVTGLDTSVVAAAANDAGGKTLLAGRCQTNAGDNDFCVWRLNRDGGNDNTFSGNGSTIFNMNGTSDSATAIAVQQNGRIVVAGVCTPSGQRDFCVARLLSDGNLDNSFDGNGRLSTEIDGDDEVAGVAIRRDGKIVVAGTCRQGTNDRNFCIARYETNGALDDTFFVGQGKRVVDLFGQDDSAAALLVQPNNGTIIAGTCKPTSSANNQFCVTRLFASGQFDTTFATTGKRAIDVLASSVQSLGAAALQPDGKIVLAGSCSVNSIRLMCAVRLNADGSDDDSFDGDARAILLNYAEDSYVTSVSVQPDGKIVLAGYCNTASGFQFCWDRLHPDGSRDDSIGANRVVTAVGTTADTVSAVLTTPDGKIALAGSCRRTNSTIIDACVARYEGGPLGYTNCKLDIDGDGVTLSTIDSLIVSRLANGVRSGALIGGISFPPNATRNTWPLIRDYLMNQCGIALL